MHAEHAGFWVGSYTGARGAGRGIYRMRRRPDGGLALDGLAAATDSPSYLAAHPTRNVLYAAGEATATVLAFDVVGARLVPSGRVPVPVGPCHLLVHPPASLLAACYRAGCFAALGLGADGTLTGATSVLAGHGHGPRPDRQDRPHPHALAVAPDGVVLGTDLGADLLRAMRVDPRTGELRLVAELSLPAGAGPRHLLVHPSGPVFVLTELSHTILVLRPGSGGYADLAVVAELPATAAPVAADALCAAIKLGPGGRFLYTSTRGADIITTHELRDDGGRPVAVADTDCGGRRPRDFCVDGQRLHVANEHSGTVTSFTLDPDTGRPHAISGPAEVPSPVCIVADRPC